MTELVRFDPSLWSDAAVQRAAREAPNACLDDLAPHTSMLEGILFNFDVRKPSPPVSYVKSTERKQKSASIWPAQSQ